jgi:ketosteroid isomerase-like protein
MTAPALTEAALIQMEHARLAAMARNDVDAIAAVVHSECVYTHSPGDRDTRETYLEKCQSGVIQYNALTTTVEKVILRGDVALVFGTMDGDAQVAGAPRKLHNCYTAAWTPEDGEWRLIAFQPTPIKL